MKKLILVVDDDERNRTLFSDVLSAAGHETITAENGGRVIELARSAKPDLILMDVQMPVIDGLAAVRRLKADPELRAIPAIALTAQAMDGDRERLLAAGFDDYVSKPVPLQTLRAVVAKHLNLPKTSPAAGRPGPATTPGAGAHGRQTQGDLP